MIWEDLRENLIIPELEAKSSEEVFHILGGKLVEAGLCKETYVDALKEREKDYPTGINMGDFGIAMPHTDREHVNKSGVAIGRLTNPVLFYQMGTRDEEVKAKLIFMLAVDDPDEHMDFLQRIILILQDQEVLGKLLHAKDNHEFIDIIKEKENTL